MGRTLTLYTTPKVYVLSLGRSIAAYRKDHASQEYMNYLYGLYYEALDILWEAQQRGEQDKYPFIIKR